MPRANLSNQSTSQSFRNTNRSARRRPPRVDTEDQEALALLQGALAGLLRADDLTAGEVALRSAQYKASALGEYCPEVAFDPTATKLRAAGAQQRRGAARWARWQESVRSITGADLAQEGPIGLVALDRTCEALHVVLSKNPHAEAADRHTLARATDRGLILGPTALARYRASRFTELTATAYPRASAAVLQVANDWHYWLWSFDDRTDVRGEDLANDLARHEQVVDALLTLLAGRELPATAAAEDPNVLFLGQILADLRIVAPAACVDRFCEAVRAYLVRGSLAGAQNWAAGHTPDPETFLAQRIHEGAYDTVLPFIELAAACATADDAVTSLEARRAALLANQIVVVTNDILSYEKEITHNGNPNNLLHAVQIHEHRNLRDSYLRVVAMIESWTSELLAIEARSTGDLRRYIRGNYTWIAASYNWHFVTGRYASPTSPFRELRRAKEEGASGG